MGLGKCWRSLDIPETEYAYGASLTDHAAPRGREGGIGGQKGDVWGGEGVGEEGVVVLGAVWGWEAESLSSVRQSTQR